MATSRLARFISESCPPQIVSVMRRRTAKVLDTINEEDQRSETLASSSSSSSSSTKLDKFSLSSPSSPMAASPQTSTAAVSSKYFLNQVPIPRSFAAFDY